MEVSTGHLRIETNGKKKVISYAINILTFIRLIDFIYVLLASPQIHQLAALQRFILHFVNVVTCAYGVAAYTIQFVLKPYVTAAIFNTFFVEETRRGFDTGKREQKMRKNMLKYSVQELAAMGCLVLFILSNIVITLFASHLQMEMHLFYRLPPGLQTNSTFYGLLGMEICFAVVWAATATFNVNMQLLFFQKMNDVLDHRISVLRKFNANRGHNFQILEEYRQCHKLHLFLLLFNSACSKLIFGLKCLCMCCTILCGYYTIQNFDEEPVLAGLFGLLTFNSIVAFAVIYDKAFSIPEKFQIFKEELHVASKMSNLTPLQERLIEKTIYSDRNVGIQVAGFHNFERASTIRFVDFVSRNISGLLIAT
ncbi:unnamed protein product [Allacma fusca]|uniref:Uncharacterized protein n=1 Tax=Allacma fusca TaxID=39272 RepID=A0A8J2NNI3_9HEXA|nr:unnamed protein product [Allacma fusca]